MAPLLFACFGAGQPRRSRTELLFAVTSGKLQDVRQILDCAPGLASTVKSMDNSPLHLAVGAGREDIAAEIVRAVREGPRRKAGQSAEQAVQQLVNQPNSQGATPLMLACKAGSVECIQLLLAAGADPYAADRESTCTCLHYAARYGCVRVIEALLGDDNWVPSPAGSSGRRILLRKAMLFSETGLFKYIDGPAFMGVTPLYLAITHGHQAAAAALIKHGAALTSRCNLFLQGEDEGPCSCIPHSTPLHVTAAKGDVATARLLLETWVESHSGAQQTHQRDPRTLRDAQGQRPVDVAYSLGNTALLHMLNPCHPLHEALNPPEERVPPLAVLAAEALQRHLTAQLDGLAAQHAKQAEQPSCCAHAAAEERPWCPVCLEDGCAAEASDAEEQRPWQLVAVAGCGHMLCMTCAKKLSCEVQAAECGLLKCPLCRGAVSGWQAAKP